PSLSQLSVIESPMKTIRASPFAGGASWALPSRYRPRAGQSPRMEAARSACRCTERSAHWAGVAGGGDWDRAAAGKVRTASTARLQRLIGFPRVVARAYHGAAGAAPLAYARASARVFRQRRSDDDDPPYRNRCP